MHLRAKILARKLDNIISDAMSVESREISFGIHLFFVSVELYNFGETDCAMPKCLSTMKFEKCAEFNKSCLISINNAVTIRTKIYRVI